MLRVDELKVDYGPVNALDGVSLEVSAGEAIGVIGPNGAGKSTLLATITGMVKPSQGEIEFEGKSIVGTSPETLVERGISLVPEGRRIFGPLSVAENLQLGATVARRAKGKSSAPSVDEVLERFPALRALTARQAGSLSGGEQQMLAIARALLSGPRLLLLDEPSLGLAPKIVDDVFALLRDLHGEGTTILLIEQNALKTVRFADRTYVLRTGSIVMSGARDELSQRADFAEEYLGV
ncbi:MAG: ABC transporter ATP-binding protein [Gaiellaceae bacterium]